MANKQQERTGTSTQIRNLYAEGMSYMRIMFYNTSLSFALYPFITKDSFGHSQYDTKHGQQTTVDFAGAFALYQVSRDIIDGKINETRLNIPCMSNALITLERRASQNGGMETIFSISKNSVIIPFKFQTIEQQVTVNGQSTTKIIESGLGALMKTIEGYLTGINADRHLDKLTEDYVKSLENKGNNAGNNQSGGYNNNGYNNNYQGNGYQKKSYNNNNNGGYRRQYNNGNGYNNNYRNNNNQNQQPNQQNFSTYNVHD